MSGPDVKALFAELRIDLPNRAGPELSVRCFANSGAHKRGDKDPSCSVNTDSGAWCCHACGAKGGAYDAAVATGCTAREAMELLKRCASP